ncbi:class II aldolase/adducin family protein [Nocardia sp. KC 131]|uniref:class II aldolase/adducin family protein n=1 Tax=Nocardia arseniciresistens TaxID=3392119 RepID=UPI00398F1B7B
MIVVKNDHDAAEIRLRRELAAVYRLVAHFGMADLIFTHISLRLPGPTPRFLINPYGLLFEEITASSLVVVDPSGRPVGASGQPVNPAGFVIHGAIHAARPDAHCVLHTHTRAGCAVAATSEGLLPVNQMSMEFYGRIGYHDYEGVALDLDEQARLVLDIGEHPALILRNHGLLTVGTTAAQAFLRMHYLNRACEIQVTAAAAGTLILPPSDVCERSARQLTGADDGDDYTDTAGYDLAWAALLRLLDRVAPGYTD